MTSRRDFLSIAAAAPLVALGASRALAEGAACADPASLPMAQQGMRQSLNYLPASPDVKKHCALCAFFKGDKPGCGACQLLNGPVDAGGVCDSFAAKQA